MAAELHPAVDYQSVIPDSHAENYSDRLLVLKPSSLKEDYRHEEFQYFFAESGFGCDPEKLGTKVFGRFLIDGEESAFRRYDFYGIADEEKLPGWAKEKLTHLTQNETAPAAGPEISM